MTGTAHDEQIRTLEWLLAEARWERDEAESKLNYCVDLRTMSIESIEAWDDQP